MCRVISVTTVICDNGKSCRVISGISDKCERVMKLQEVVAHKNMFNFSRCGGNMLSLAVVDDDAVGGNDDHGNDDNHEIASYDDDNDFDDDDDDVDCASS